MASLLSSLKLYQILPYHNKIVQRQKNFRSLIIKHKMAGVWLVHLFLHNPPRANQLAERKEARIKPETVLLNHPQFPWVQNIQAQQKSTVKSPNCPMQFSQAKFCIYSKPPSHLIMKKERLSGGGKWASLKMFFVCEHNKKPQCNEQIVFY
jgi:hypothetical protein